MVSTSSQLLGTATTRSARPKPSARSSRTRLSSPRPLLAQQILAGDAQVDLAGDQARGDVAGRQQAHRHARQARQLGAVAARAAGHLQLEAAVGQPGLDLFLQPALGRQGEDHRVRAHCAAHLPGLCRIRRRPRPGRTHHAAHGPARRRAAQAGEQAVVAAAGGHRPLVAEGGAAHLEEHAVVVAEGAAEGGRRRSCRFGHVARRRDIPAALIPDRQGGHQGVRLGAGQHLARRRAPRCGGSLIVRIGLHGLGLVGGQAAGASGSRRARPGAWTISAGLRPPTGSTPARAQSSSSTPAASSPGRPASRSARRLGAATGPTSPRQARPSSGAGGRASALQPRGQQRRPGRGCRRRRRTGRRRRASRDRSPRPPAAERAPGQRGDLGVGLGRRRRPHRPRCRSAGTPRRRSAPGGATRKALPS